MAGLHNLFLAARSHSSSNSTHPPQDPDKCSKIQVMAGQFQGTSWSVLSCLPPVWVWLCWRSNQTVACLWPHPSTGGRGHKRSISRKPRARFYKCTHTPKDQQQTIAQFQVHLDSIRLTHHGGNTGAGGQHDAGESLAKWPVLLRGPVVERVVRKGKCSVGSLRYQWKCVLCATAGSRGAFLYLPLLIPSTTERQCQRNTHQEYFQERMAEPITIQASRKMFQSR